MNPHNRARDLILAGAGDDAQRSWLEQHLADCPRCASLAGLASSASGALRARPELAPPAVVHATHLLVRARALQLAETRARMRMLWIGMAIGILVGIATTPLLWIFAEWVGETYALPSLAWQAGFFVLWFIPASFAAAIALAVRPAALEGRAGGNL
jgi:anti-sigma factor RsiW